MKIRSTPFDWLMLRYNRAYITAARIVRFGNILRAASILLGAAIVAWGFYSSRADYSFIHAIGLPETLIGFFIAIAGYASGVVIACRGQMMQATIDTAVNTSTFLSPEEKWAVLTLK